MLSDSLLPLLSLALATAVGLTIASHYVKPERPWLRWIFKPLATVLVLAIALLPRTFLTERYAAAIALGLVFSLVGDVFLLLPRRWFVASLIAFLIAHLAYWIGLFPSQPEARLLVWLVGIFAAVLALGRLLHLAAPAGLAAAITAYSLVMAGTVALAAFRLERAPSTSALAASPGASLLFLSDTILALDRFRRPFRFARLIVLLTYYSGQFLMARSVGLPGS